MPLKNKELLPVNEDFFSEFEKEKCNFCGDCLNNCPIIDLSKEEAKRELENLISGQGTKKILSECQSCFTCDFYCPENAHPTNLILQKWNRQYKEEGLKVRGEYYMTLYPHYPNFRSYVMEHLPKETKKLVASWASLEPLKGDTLTYPGCNVITFAELTQTSIFKDLEIRGRLEYCCGETLFRTGYKEKLFQVSERLDKWFNTLKPKHLLVLCTAGTNVFKNVLPNYGLKYQFESIKSYLEYIWEKIQNNEIVIRKKLDLTVTIQESCYAKMFGDEYMNLPRKILNYIGVTVKESPAIREDMRCCGIGAGFSVDSAYHPLKIRSSALKNLKDFKNTDADAVCVYCAGCLATLMTAQKLSFKNMKVYHILELIQMAIGETPISEKAK
ncbi:MAG: (Fe-S)-binding protein, partial [Promethearchaeota archaeon]